MTLKEYQKKAMTTCMESSKNLPYMLFNLQGEVGELSSKIAKLIRKEKIWFSSFVDNADMWNNSVICAHGKDNLALASNEEIQKEIGDILWQTAGVCYVLGLNLEDIAQQNLDKLAARKVAGTIDGSGDGITKEEGRV